jgi:hypothetical protein
MYFAQTVAQIHLLYETTNLHALPPKKCFLGLRYLEASIFWVVFFATFHIVFFVILVSFNGRSPGHWFAGAFFVNKNELGNNNTKCLFLSSNVKIYNQMAKKDHTIQSTVKSYPENHGSLGKRIEFGARSHITKNKAGATYEFFTPTIELMFGIGKDHVGRLVMDETAWKALKKGAKVNIDSFQEFKKRFL